MATGQFHEMDRTFYAEEAVYMDRLARFDASGTSGGMTPSVRLCRPQDRPIGVFREAKASGNAVTVRAFQKYATLAVEVAEAVSKGDYLYPAEDGKARAHGFRPFGIALEDGSGDGSKVEFIWLPDEASLDADDDVFEFSDDFLVYTSGAEWSLVAPNGGSAAIEDAKNGVLKVVDDDGVTVADNDEAYFYTTKEIAKFEANKPIYFRARIKHTEAATDDANLIVGLVDGVAADLLVDDGGGLAASKVGAVFYKVDGGTVWQAALMNDEAAASSYTTDSDAGAHNSGSWEVLEIVWVPTTSTSGTAYFYKDGVLGATLTADYTNATEMAVVLGVKSGSAVQESLYIDKVTLIQGR